MNQIGLLLHGYNLNMSDERRKRKRSWLPTLPGVALLLAIYVGGYFTLSERWTIALPIFLAPPVVGPYPKPHVSHYRRFSHPLLKSAYFPVGWFEAKIRGEKVVLSSK